MIYRVKSERKSLIKKVNCSRKKNFKVKKTIFHVKIVKMGSFKSQTNPIKTKSYKNEKLTKL